jgi:hypothetical protein
MTTVNNDATWPVHHFYAMGSHMSAWLDLADQHLAQTVLQQVEALFQASAAPVNWRRSMPRPVNGQLSPMSFGAS